MWNKCDQLKLYCVLYAQFVEYFLHFAALRQIFIQIEKILECEFAQGQWVPFARWKTRYIQRLLDTSSIVFIGRKLFYYAAKWE